MTYTKYPQACKALMTFMMEADQFNNWLEAAQGYLIHSLKAYDANPVMERSEADRAPRRRQADAG